MTGSADFSGYYTYFSAPSDANRDIKSSPFISSPEASRPTSSTVPQRVCPDMSYVEIDGNSDSHRVALSLLESVLMDPRDMHRYDDNEVQVGYYVVEAESDTD